MPTLTHPGSETDSDKDLDPEQEHYDREFNDIVSHIDDEPEPGSTATETPPKSEDNDEGSLFNKNEAESDDKKKRSWRTIVKKHKKLLLGGGVTAILAAFVFILFLLGSLVIPNLASHMMVYGFARAARNTADSVASVDATDMALENTTDTGLKAFLSDIKGKLVDDTGIGSVINKFSTYNQKRPANVWKNLNKSGDIVYHYNTDNPVLSFDLGNGKALQFQRLDPKVAVTVKGVDYPDPTKITNIKNFAQNPLQYFKDAYSNKQGVRAVLTDPTSSGVLGKMGNWLVRGKVMDTLLENIDAHRFRWTITDLQKDEKANAATAEAEDTVISYRETTGNGASTEASAASSGNQIQEGAQAAQQEVQKCATDVNCVKNGKILPSVVTKLNSVYSSSAATKALKGLSISYAILVPLCLMYQASIKNSGTVINNNVGNAQRQFVSFQAAADQQKTGAVNKTQVVNGTAIGGLASNLTGPTGDNALENSDIEQISRGQTPDTSDTSDLETGGDGQHTYTDIFNTFLPAALANAFSAIATPTCDIFANVWSGAALAIAQLGAAIVPGLGEIVDGGAQVTARAVAVVITKNLVKTASNFFSKKELAKLGAVTTVTVAGAVFAKVIAAHTAGVGYDGTAQGAEAADFAAQGALTLGGDYDRSQNCAVPLTAEQIIQIKQRDGISTAKAAQSASIFQRYFAIKNPQSLLNNLAVTTALHMRASSVSTMLSSAVQAFNPMRALSRLATAIHPAIVSAATPYSAAAQDYGLVQFGWPVDQEDAYTSNGSYGMIQNQLVLDASNLSEQISAKYGKCFSEPIGTMLSSGDVQLNGDANVQPDVGDCSPNNLGMNNCSFKYKNECDMVYRWRVACRNNNAQQDLLDAQSIAPSPSSSSNSPSSSSSAPTSPSTPTST